jgi:hypothetical protein
MRLGPDKLTISKLDNTMRLGPDKLTISKLYNIELREIIGTNRSNLNFRIQI